MRILETSELNQVSGAGLLGLGLNLNLLDLLGVKARVNLGDNDRRSGRHDRGNDRCGRGNRGHNRHCY